MSKDPYKILGVEKDADEKSIKSAYRNLAKKYHPDLNPDDKDADTKFKEAGAAYELLRDKDKRAAFDRGEIDMNGNPTYAGMHGGGMGGGTQNRQYYRDFADHGGAQRYYNTSDGHMNPEDLGDLGDIFGSFFGGGRARHRGGAPDMDELFRQHQNADVQYKMDVDFMDAAKGGQTQIAMPDGKPLVLSIPAGVKQGQKLRMKGKGQELPDGRKGDAFIEVNIKPHKFFTRQDRDIYSEVPIALHEAVLGGQINIKTIHGDVGMTLPKGTSSGQKFRLKGKGIKEGHHYATVKIVMPEKIDEELESAVRDWAQNHNYNPREKTETVI